MSSFLMFDHALTDRVGLNPILSLLRSDNDCVERDTVSIDIETLKGVVELIKLTFNEDYQYFCLWLTTMNNLQDKFTPLVAEYLNGLRDNTMLYNVLDVIQYLNRRDLKVTVTGEGYLTPDIIEAITNASKYGKSYILIEFSDVDCLISNDIDPLKSSGTQNGLNLHDIQCHVDDGVFQALCIMNNPASSIVSVSNIIHIAKEVGWSIIPRINENVFKTEEMKLVASLTGTDRRFFEFRSQEIKQKVLERIRMVLNENVDCKDCIWITKSDFHMGVDISVGFKPYGGIGIFPLFSD